jgi:hypothetical protein
MSNHSRRVTRVEGNAECRMQMQTRLRRTLAGEARNFELTRIELKTVNMKTVNLKTAPAFVGLRRARPETSDQQRETS